MLASLRTVASHGAMDIFLTQGEKSGNTPTPCAQNKDSHAHTWLQASGTLGSLWWYSKANLFSVTDNPGGKDGSRRQRTLPGFRWG